MSKQPQIITDWLPSGGTELGHHQVALCLLLALNAPPADCFGLLPGLTPGQLSMLQDNKIIKARTEEFRETYLGENASEQLKNHMPAAMKIMAETLQSPDMKLERKFEAAKWLIEMNEGKARQKLDVTSSVSLHSFLKELEGLREEREAGPATILLNSAQAKAADPIDRWVEEHIAKETR